MQEKTVDLWSPARREQQFEQLFYSEYDRMYRAAHILLGNEDEAKDVVQDVFAQVPVHCVRSPSPRSCLLASEIAASTSLHTVRQNRRPCNC